MERKWSPARWRAHAQQPLRRWNHRAVAPAPLACLSCEASFARAADWEAHVWQLHGGPRAQRRAVYYKESKTPHVVMPEEARLIVANYHHHFQRCGERRAVSTRQGRSTRPEGRPEVS
jgi:hypothetical protein